MSIQSDRWIRKQTDQRRIIEPFSEKQLAARVHFRGISLYGYRMRASTGGVG